ncbi:MAG: YihY/virulence factor BrkB family protein [Firmicutes bacterium]|nr:YihY/virulence factor BrkB family protein [Bacillota bacterium]
MNNIKSKMKIYLKKFFKVLTRPDMTLLPGQLAFFLILSVVPIVTLVSYGASFLHLPVDFISNFIEKAFNKTVANLIVPIVSGVTLSKRFYVTLIIGYYIASNGAASIIVTSNTIYGIKDSGFFKRRLKAMIITLILVLLFLFILIVPVFGTKLIEMIAYVDLNPRITHDIAFIMRVLKGPVTWFIIFFFIKLIYTMAPDRKIPASYVSKGAIFTSVFWVIATYGYSYYIANFAHYNVFYGGLSNVIILMLWVYLLAYIFTIGMAINYNDEQEKLEKTGGIKQIKE